ncbi:hypothetical protein [Pseudomonas vanderleydeniana]|uniref:Uncharacterized protein n=1 Tax=Pseudomonas vanderleydeniana TaxID=2745495 RepID=A0A9E6PRE2_9PSED|nr:hypothetical protein [Pseudomonas vanderleydeniana]QXI31188.1 hypothetical protein HU752_015175 [Pseudomonas vanderleydeniana]
MKQLRLIALSASLATDLVQADPSGKERAHLEDLLRQLDTEMQPVPASADRSTPPNR